MPFSRTKYCPSGGYTASFAPRFLYRCFSDGATHAGSYDRFKCVFGDYLLLLVRMYPCSSIIGGLVGMTAFLARVYNYLLGNRPLRFWIRTFPMCLRFFSISSVSRIGCILGGWQEDHISIEVFMFRLFLNLASCFLCFQCRHIHRVLS